MGKSAGYVCVNCEVSHPKWVGRCTRCGQFDTVVEAAPVASSVGLAGTVTAGSVTRPARPAAKIDATAFRHTPTGQPEFDRVLAGGLVAGQVVLLYGAPGVGKSTLLLSVANSFASSGRTVLVVSGEESAEQVALRAQRIGADSDRLFIADETDLGALLAHVDQVRPELLIVDSIQALGSAALDGRIGGIAQVHEVTMVLTRLAKASGMPVILVGQVTKSEDTAAGAMSVFHATDTVMAVSLSGDDTTGLRMLRVHKNRFGSVDELAVYEQTAQGMTEVLDPSGLFLLQRETAICGAVVTVAMDGRRALPVEVQALVVPTNATSPKRGVSGLDPARMSIVTAVVERHCGIRLHDRESYLSTVGGLRVVEPAADLAACVAIASSVLDAPIPGDLVAIGEVVLSGEVRRVPGMAQRLGEVRRLGFRRVLAPEGTEPIEGMTVIPIPHVGHAMTVLDALKTAVSPQA